MRTTFFAAAILTLATGCTSTSRTQIQPAPAPIRDHKTPVALSRPSITQRLDAQRIQDAQIARNPMSIEGGVIR